MARLIMCVVFVSALCLTTGCGGSSPARKAERGSTYRKSLVSASRAEIFREAEETLILRYGFRFKETRTSSSDDIRFETSWKDVQITGDERKLGYQGAQTRILLTARPRNRLAGSSESFTVQFVGEVRLLDKGLWKRVPMTEQRKAYFKEIAEYMNRKFQTGF